MPRIYQPVHLTDTAPKSVLEVNRSGYTTMQTTKRIEIVTLFICSADDLKYTVGSVGISQIFLLCFPLSVGGFLQPNLDKVLVSFRPSLFSLWRHHSMIRFK